MIRLREAVASSDDTGIPKANLNLYSPAPICVLDWLPSLKFPARVQLNLKVCADGLTPRLFFSPGDSIQTILSSRLKWVQYHSGIRHDRRARALPEDSHHPRH